ncbi:hypothetical protein [uncultured Maricaulis sp.]|uniref:hypothetical protein n=1 Tax=uncultured Maricaulis sp. TaxID=174710 RepID=UPI0030DCC1C1|tara:strand:- start:44081 stop:44722 length:642 start_codon:yes stop_codon:yes gene_type:complete
MTQDIDNARADLAFMRELVSDTAPPGQATGQSLFAAGLIYGVQTLLQWAEFSGRLEITGIWMLAVITGPTLVFLVVLTLILRSRPRSTPKTMAGRALDYAFSAIGITNLCLLTIFWITAVKLDSPYPWFSYGAAIFAVQGMVWFIAFRIRQRLWLGAVSAGWFLTAVLLALTAGTSEFVLVASLGMFALLALPGWVMMRGDSDASASGSRAGA